MKNLIYLSNIILVFCFFSCSDNSGVFEERVPILPENNYDYKIPSDGSLIFGNPPIINDSKATLGRVLFYDNNLSGNKSVSCASCHKQHLGFADNTSFSTGANVTKTLRNSPSLSNLFSYPSFFWDGRTNNLEELIFQPIADHIEMRFSNEEVLVDRLERTSYYPDLFQNAFGSPEINKEKISEAMAEFLESMVGIDSKFDRANSSDLSTFSLSERNGMDLFHGKATCGSCHRDSNLGAMGGAANIGLDIQYEDNGISHGRFKIPSLRNVALSSPYMHDGRFSTLREVINHYNKNIQPHGALSWQLTEEGRQAIEDFNNNGGWWNQPPNGGTPTRLNLTESEIDDLEAFLNTLTDWNYVNDVRFSDPF